MESLINQLIEALWPVKMKLQLLKYLVRSCDGRDFRAKDIGADYLGSTRAVFYMNGFDRILSYLWKTDPTQTESIFRSWLTQDKVLLGNEKHGSESSIATWTLCALFIMSTEESAISPQRAVTLIYPKESFIIRYGGALVDRAPNFMTVLLNHFGRTVGNEADEILLMLLASIRSARHDSKKSVTYQVGASVAMQRLARPADFRIAERLIYVAAGNAEYHDDLWKHVENLIAGEIDVSTLSRFLDTRWSAVIKFVRTNLPNIRSTDGVGSPRAYYDVVLSALLVLGVEEKSVLTEVEKRRLTDLAGFIHIFRDQCKPLHHQGARELEELLLLCNAESFRILELDAWTDDVTGSSDPDAIRYLAYFAGDRHGSKKGEQQRLAESVAPFWVPPVR
jgi:hypothetical protein